MKKIIIKAISLVLISVFCFAGVSAFAVERTKTFFASDNTEFAVRTAETIEKYDSKNSAAGLNSASPMLRVIGRVSSADFDFSQLGANVCIIGSDGRFVLQFSSLSALKDTLNTLQSDSRVVYAERDRIVYTNSDGTTESEHLSWGVEALGIDEYSAYTKSIENTAVTVAIIDSGVEKIDFVKDRLVGGYDFVDNDSDGANDTSVDSHGTFLASMIVDCTRGNNVNIMPVRVLSSKSGSLINAVNGIYYAVDNGADVLNISLGGELKNCSSLDDALNYAEANNVCAVISSGNAKMDTENYCPAHIESAITVSAVDESLAFASTFSNYGDEVDVVAPGVGISGYSATGSQKTMNGTSMSAAYISAGVALFRLNHPGCTASQVQQAVKDCCLDLGAEGFDIYYGYGMPQFDRLISFEEEVYPVSLCIAQLPEKTKYTYKSSEMNLDGLVLEVTYSDGTKSIVDNADVEISGFDTASTGEKIITAEYLGFIARFSITVEYAWWQHLIRILLFGFIWY